MSRQEGDSDPFPALRSPGAACFDCTQPAP
jgi:hypothetical protein